MLAFILLFKCCIYSALLTVLRVGVQVSPEEWKSIMTGLLSGNADLRNGGYMRQGLFYKCRNGHPYVIGDCGGATQTRRCRQCGEHIGGTQHRLDNSNAPHEEMQRMARNIGGSRN